jgi:hypothetical protein
VVTSFLLSSQNPLHTPEMGLGKFIGLSTSSSSKSSSSRTRGAQPPLLGPGSSKVDYAYGLNPPPGPSTSQGLAHSFYHGHDDEPPAYSPQKTPDFHDYAPDIKMPVPGATHTGMVDFPTPHSHGPVDSTGESPLLMLAKFDIVVILDDSYSMVTKDIGARSTRWEQVSNYPLIPRPRARYRGPK